MRRDIDKLIRQKALQGDTDFFRRISLSAFSDKDHVDTCTVTVNKTDDNAIIVEDSEE